MRLKVKGLPAVVCWFCLLRLPCLGQAEPPPATLAELQQRLSDHLAQPKFAAAFWGVKIVSLTSGRTLFEHSPQKLFSPASNSKLYTVALALDRLGPDYRIRTSLYGKAKPDKRGTLNGDLIVYGRGDPCINARLHGGSIAQALAPLAAALTNAGVRRIKGDLVGDESFFHGPELGSGWCWDDLEFYYGAEISALTINDNTLQAIVTPGEKAGAPCRLALSPPTGWLIFSNRTETVDKEARRTIRFYRPVKENVVYVTGKMPLGDGGYTNDVTMHNPAGLFLWFFREALASHGIKVSGQSRTVNWLDREKSLLNCGQLVELGSIESLALTNLAREVQKPSQNLYADLLLAQVGEKARTAGSRWGETSQDLGLSELSRFLQEAGIKTGETIFEEGSGLSRNNVTTPNATVALLQYMDRHPCAKAYLEALPIAGVDGTLRNRMKGTAAAGNVRAKTGTLRWANALSGYVQTAGGERVAFSLMLNRYHNPGPTGSARDELDKIVVLLAGFTGRSG